jgi:hypothetical protein
MFFIKEGPFYIGGKTISREGQDKRVRIFSFLYGAFRAAAFSSTNERYGGRSFPG